MLRIATLALAAFLLPATARAVTVRDIIELSKAGVGDIVLTALIEVDGTIFTLDAQEILDLREKGVSDVVIAKMIQTRVAIPHAISTVPPYYPHVVVVPVPVRTHRRDDAGDERIDKRTTQSRAKMPSAAFRIRNGDFVR